MTKLPHKKYTAWNNGRTKVASPATNYAAILEWQKQHKNWSKGILVTAGERIEKLQPVFVGQDGNAYISRKTFATQATY